MKIESSEFKALASCATSRYQLWCQILSLANVKDMVEIGVWKGDFSKEILEGCDFIDRYYMVDPWANLPDWNKPYNVKTQMFEAIYAEAMEKTKFASQKLVILRGRTKDVISDITDGSLDFAYIDGDHTLRGITIDLIKLLPKMREGGLIGGDDFTNNAWLHGSQFEPSLVCPFGIYFAEAMDLPIVALPFNQFIIQKRTNTSFSFFDATGSYRDISLNKNHQKKWARKVKNKLKRVYEKVLFGKKGGGV